jgi:uncharacterized protein YqeY
MADMTDSADTPPLQQRLEHAMTEARRARHRERTSVLSMTLAEVRNRRIEAGRPLTDEDVIEVVGKARKRRQEAADQMRAGGREALAVREEEEGEILAEFLPQPLSPEEVRAMVREIVEGGTREMGPLMGQLMPRLRGRFDGKEAQRLVREALSPS